MVLCWILKFLEGIKISHVSLCIWCSLVFPAHSVVSCLRFPEELEERWDVLSIVFLLFWTGTVCAFSWSDNALWGECASTADQVSSLRYCVLEDLFAFDPCL